MFLHARRQERIICSFRFADYKLNSILCEFPSSHGDVNPRRIMGSTTWDRWLDSFMQIFASENAQDLCTIEPSLNGLLISPKLNTLIDRFPLIDAVIQGSYAIIMVIISGDYNIHTVTSWHGFSICRHIERY